MSKATAYRFGAKTQAQIEQLRGQYSGNATTAVTVAIDRLWRDTMSSTRRDQQIEQVAGLIAQQVGYVGDYTLDDARRTNADGWTVNLNTDRPDTILRCEGVVLTDAELQRAWTLAESYIAQ